MTPRCYNTCRLNHGHPLTIMMTSWHEKILLSNGPFWWESIRHGWIPLTIVSNTKLWYCFCYYPEQTVELTARMAVIWCAMVSMHWNDAHVMTVISHICISLAFLKVPLIHYAVSIVEQRVSFNTITISLCPYKVEEFARVMACHLFSIKPPAKPNMISIP